MFLHLLMIFVRFPWWFSGKESGCKAGASRDAGLILGLGRSSGEGNGSPLWYSCLENSMDRGAWWATVHGLAKSWTQVKRLSSSSMIFPLTPVETVHVFKGTSNKDINIVKTQFLLYFILHKKENRLNMFNTIRQEENSAEL